MSNEYSSEERDAMQSADIARSWKNCRMFRFPQADGTYRVIQKDTDTQKVVADYVVTYAPEGVRYDDADAVVSRVGERAKDSDFKGAGWMKPKDVGFNVLTHEAVIRA